MFQNFARRRVVVLLAPLIVFGLVLVGVASATRKAAEQAVPAAAK